MSDVNRESYYERIPYEITCLILPEYGYKIK